MYVEPPPQWQRHQVVEHREWLEPGSEENNKKGNADQRQQYESREGQLSRCSSFVGEFHGRH